MNELDLEIPKLSWPDEKTKIFRAGAHGEANLQLAIVMRRKFSVLLEAFHAEDRQAWRELTVSDIDLLWLAQADEAAPKKDAIDK